MSKDKYFGKKVAVMGLGVEGVDAVKFLSSQKAMITVCDQKPASQLHHSIVQLGKIRPTMKLGASWLTNLSQYDYIFRSPGIKRNLPQIIAAEKNGSNITSSTIEFFTECRGKIIGVTGTKGKGTTATLIYQILKSSFLKVFLAGNIGTPTLTLLPQINPEDWVVLELSSFQLIDLKKSPHISVITNVYSDHMDYHSSRQEYITAKSNILKYQEPSDKSILNYDDPTCRSLSKLTTAEISYFSLEKTTRPGCYVASDNVLMWSTETSLQTICQMEKLMLRGKHNWSNVAAACAATLPLKVDIPRLQNTILSFPGLEHRLKLVRQVRAVNFYNDSFGTTPETAIAAIHSFTEPIILIAGGSDKGSNFSQLGREVVSNQVKAVIAIGKMASRIIASIEAAGNYQGKIITGLTNMQEIVKKAQELSSPGDVVLLSPACASFDMFANYKDRGNKFEEEVFKL